MKNIAILRCLKSSAVCDGSGCLKSFNNNDKDFSIFEGVDKQLVGMWTCNGCGNSKLENQDGLKRKIDRAMTQNLDMLFISRCVFKTDDSGEKELCPIVKGIAEEFVKAGINVWFGKE